MHVYHCEGQNVGEDHHALVVRKMLELRMKLIQRDKESSARMMASIVRVKWVGMCNCRLSPPIFGKKVLVLLVESWCGE